MRLKSLIVSMLLLSSGASRCAASTAFAEVVAKLTSFDRATLTATYQIDTLYRVVEDRTGQQDSLLVVTCNILGARPWSTVLKAGETKLAFPLTLQGRPCLELPAEGWRVGCHCKGQSQPKEVALYAMFVTPQGLANKVKARGGSRLVRAVTIGTRGQVQPPLTIRIRLGWTRGLLDGTAALSNARSGREAKNGARA